MASVVSVSPGQTGAFDPSGLPVATVTGAWTLVPSEFSAFMVDATNGAFAATLPKAAAWVGAPIVIKAITATANLVTLQPAGSDLIDGAALVTLGAAGTYPGVSLVSDGVQWRATALHGLPSSVETASNRLDLSRGFGIYAPAVPNTSQDITAMLQAAYNYIAANCPNGGDIELEPGTYLLNGASQTGTYTANITTVNGAAQTINQTPSTLTVASTSGLEQYGTVHVAGVTGDVSYTGTTGTTLTGCTIAAGSYTATNGGAVSLYYSYAGQILLPAIAAANSMAIRLRGKTRVMSGSVVAQGPLNGVVLQSNATSGYVFDVQPSYAEYGGVWSGIFPIFEDVAVECPSNPTCGGISLYCVQHTKLERVAIATPTPYGAPNAGSLAALVMPSISNNGDCTFRDMNIADFPVAIVLTEHGVFDNIVIYGCLSAFQAGGKSHANWFGYVDIEECPTLFNGSQYPVTGTICGGNSGTAVYGYIDTENTKTTGGLQPAAGAFVSDTTASPIQGKISWYNSGQLSLPIVGGRSLDVVPLNNAVTLGPAQKAGWRETDPYDNFARLQALSGTGAPGQCNPSLHPWRADSGTFAVSGQKLTAASLGGSSYAYCFVPVLNASAGTGGTGSQGAQRSRRIDALVNVASGATLRLVAASPVAGTGLATAGGTDAIHAVLQAGDPAIIRVDASIVGGYGSTTITAGTTYWVTLVVLCNELGYPTAVRIYVNGALQCSQGIPTSYAGLGGANPATWPYYEDGIGFYDTSSYVSLFSVAQLGPEPVIEQGIVSVLATHSQLVGEMTLCTANSFTVTLPAAAPNCPPSRVTNTGSGSITVHPPSGTLANLATGSTGDITLAQGVTALIGCDGTNYEQIG